MEHKFLHMKNKNFAESVKCALHGTSQGFRSERNFKIYTGIAAAFLLLNIATGSGIYDYVIWLALTCTVFAAELINTSIERICDALIPEKNDNARFIKDTAAGAVLITGIAFFGGEGAVLVNNIL